MLGGEQSGHVIFADHATTGDGLLTAVRFLSLAATPRRDRRRARRARCGSSRRCSSTSRCATRTSSTPRPTSGRQSRTAETELGDSGRVLVRASGTEPLVRVMVEAETRGAQPRAPCRGASPPSSRADPRPVPRAGSALVRSTLMCGIVGYVGPDEALPIILEGLRRLEYRGLRLRGRRRVDGGLSVVKRAGKLAELERALARTAPPPARSGMGHTRWATHGAPTDRNAHPHLDCSGRVAVIHNGIIENFQSCAPGSRSDGHSSPRRPTPSRRAPHRGAVEPGGPRRRVRAAVRRSRAPTRSSSCSARRARAARRREGLLAARRGSRRRRDVLGVWHPGESSSGRRA